MAIISYSDQNEYDLVHHGQDCRGWTVVDQAGNDIGKVSEMLVNTDTEMVDSVIVDGGVRLPARDIALQDGRVIVRGVFHDEESRTAQQAATTTSATSANRVYDAYDESSSNAGYVGGVTRAANDDEISIPIVEERLQVGKRTIETGGARLRTEIEEIPIEEQVTLREEHVRVERTPVNRAVTESDLTAFREGEIELTERAEVPVVNKEARVVEEVSLGKEVVEHEETVRDSVRRTDVEVEEIDSTETTRRAANQ